MTQYELKVLNVQWDAVEINGAGNRNTGEGHHPVLFLSTVLA